MQRKFEKGLRDWNITGSPTGWTRPSRRSPEAHTERKSKNGDKKARLPMTPTKLFSQPSWKSSNKKQPLISEVAKHDRKVRLASLCAGSSPWTTRFPSYSPLFAPCVCVRRAWSPT